jgi:hypothetical protein
MDDIQPEKKNAASETITQDSLQNANGLITTDKAKLDVAAEFLVIHEQQYGDYTKEEAIRVRWKIDLRLVPMLFVTQTLCAIDVCAHLSPLLPTIRCCRSRATVLILVARKSSSPTRRSMA